MTFFYSPSCPHCRNTIGHVENFNIIHRSFPIRIVNVDGRGIQLPFVPFFYHEDIPSRIQPEDRTVKGLEYFIQEHLGRF